MIEITTINTLDGTEEVDYDYILSLEEWDDVAKTLGYEYSEYTKWYIKDDDSEIVLIREVD